MLMVAIGAVADMIAIFGSGLVVNPDEGGDSESTHEQQISVFKGGTSLTSLIQAYVDLMDDEVSFVVFYI